MQTNTFRKVVKEMLVVVFGILIALFINSWKEDLNNQKFVEATLSSIQWEVLQSKKSLDGILLKHTALQDSIVTYFEDDSQSIRTVIQKSGGFQFPNIKIIGLRFFVSSKAELVEYKLISQLIEMEDLKTLLEKKFDKLADYAFEAMEKSDKQSKLKFAIHVSNVIDTESQLQSLYQDYLEEHQEEGK